MVRESEVAMCFDTYPNSTFCPNLKGNKKAGAICQVANIPVRLIEDTSIKICVGRRFETCSLYKRGLLCSVSHENESAEFSAGVTIL